MRNQHPIIKSISRGAKTAFKKLRKLSDNRQKLLIFVSIISSVTLGVIFDELILFLAIGTALAVSLILSSDNNI